MRGGRVLGVLRGGQVASGLFLGDLRVRDLLVLRDGRVLRVLRGLLRLLVRLSGGLRVLRRPVGVRLRLLQRGLRVVVRTLRVLHALRGLVDRILRGTLRLRPVGVLLGLLDAVLGLVQRVLRVLHVLGGLVDRGLRLLAGGGQAPRLLDGLRGLVDRLLHGVGRAFRGHRAGRETQERARGHHARGQRSGDAAPFGVLASAHRFGPFLLGFHGAPSHDAAA